LLNNYKYTEIIKSLRQLDASTEKIKVQQVEIFKNPPKLVATVISNQPLTEQVISNVEKTISSYMPSSYKQVSVIAKKVKADEELVKTILYNKLSTSYLYLPISKDDIQVKQRGDQVKISLRLQPSQQTLYVSNKISNQLIDYLSNEFCEDFIIELISINRRITKQFPKELKTRKVMEAAGYKYKK
jgi:hypothetical protein